MWDGRVGAAIVEEQERDDARNLHKSQPSVTRSSIAQVAAIGGSK